MKVLKEVMVDRAKRERHTISNSVSIYIHVYMYTTTRSFRKKIDYNVTLPWVLKQVKC